MTNYFENEELNRLLNMWLNNAPESFHPLDINRFIQFSIKALELDKYNLDIILKALRESNAIAAKDERITDTYGSYHAAIDALYWELKKQGKISEEDN